MNVMLWPTQQVNGGEPFIAACDDTGLLHCHTSEILLSKQSAEIGANVFVQNHYQQHSSRKRHPVRIDENKQGDGQRDST